MKLSDFFSSYGLSAFMSQDEVIQDFDYGRRLPCITNDVEGEGT